MESVLQIQSNMREYVKVILHRVVQEKPIVDYVEELMESPIRWVLQFAEVVND